MRELKGTSANSLFLIPSCFHVRVEGLALHFPYSEHWAAQVGNICHIAATTETTGNELTSRRAFDSQQRYRLRWVV